MGGSSSSTNNADTISQSKVQNRELERKVKEIEESLKNDQSQANIIAQFANVEPIDGLDRMYCVKVIVNSMGDEWREIIQDENGLAEIVGYKGVDDLKNIRGEYFFLLLKTNIVIAGLLEESEMQKEDVVDGSLGVVDKAMYNDENRLSNCDRLEYEESVKFLVQWIDQTELVQITKQWNALCQKLEAQESAIERAAAISANKVKLLWGGFWSIDAATVMLKRYIKTCKDMQCKVDRMRTTHMKIRRRTNHMLDKQSCLMIKRWLEALGRYFDAYMEQGNVLVSVIEQVCAEFINAK